MFIPGVAGFLGLLLPIVATTVTLVGLLCAFAAAGLRVLLASPAGGLRPLFAGDNAFINPVCTRRHIAAPLLLGLVFIKRLLQQIQ